MSRTMPVTSKRGRQCDTADCARGGRHLMRLRGEFIGLNRLPVTARVAWFDSVAPAILGSPIYRVRGAARKFLRLPSPPPVCDRRFALKPADSSEWKDLTHYKIFCRASAVDTRLDAPKEAQRRPYETYFCVRGFGFLAARHRLFTPQRSSRQAFEGPASRRTWRHRKAAPKGQLKLRCPKDPNGLLDIFTEMRCARTGKPHLRSATGIQAEKEKARRVPRFQCA